MIPINSAKTKKEDVDTQSAAATVAVAKKRSKLANEYITRQMDTQKFKVKMSRDEVTIIVTAPAESVSHMMQIVAEVLNDNIKFKLESIGCK